MKHLFVPLLLLTGLQAVAQQSPAKFTLDVRYLISLPDGYSTDSTGKWPLLIFLHGSGESGTNLDKVKAHGPPKLVEAGKKFPVIIVSPQSDFGGWDAGILQRLIHDLKTRYRVDADRVYMTGLSMGGYGTWEYASRFAGDLAAIVPICGGGRPEDAWKMRYLPTWCFHGGKDNVVLPSQSADMINALKPYQPGVKFTVYPDAGHDSWTEAYNSDSLWTWLLAQRRHEFKPVPVAPAILAKHAGIYVRGERDTVVITPAENSLQLQAGRGKETLKPASETVFYWMEKTPVDIIFNKEGFLFRGRLQEQYKKVK
ncbi:carboxylesterase family protein [Chitinophaga rhizosphaerae]|uniref:carboxylesterase family protein n=1 Tax=Chitinophaga rhizosphaerae TaxID=1864947 RepID=UPI000F7FD3F7|nr:dienelactone hydrolase family protein [Chitinophaga rhizosphaerae]